ncbi:MAG TPA: hypothetical protein PLX66_02560 [Bacilli bacterium]|nr:hypothetical protein [Bacilli bacterium]
MILKKPYAFLIKHFRLIHLFLAIAAIYLTYKTNKIVVFFNSYIKNGYRLTETNIASNYVTIFMYLAIIVILITALIIYLLFKEKDKPRKFYAYLIVYYILLFGLLTFAHGALSNLELTTVAAKTVRVYRDLSLIFSLPQYFFLVFALLRGIGFDIKKFNFSKDISELQIEAKDNEEFEFILDVPGYKVKRTLRRTLRELKYFVLENTFVLICVGVLTLGIIGTTIYMNRSTRIQTYKENQSFSYDNYKMQVLDSIITPLDYDGSILTEGKTYLVVSLSIINNTILEKELDTTDFRLLVDDEIIYPTQSKNEHFIDLGDPYNNEEIAEKDTSNYILIFELNEDQIKDKYTLRIQESLSFSDNEIIATYKEVTLIPTVIDTVKTDTAVALNEEIDLKDSSLSNSKLLVSSYEITKSYKYNYTFCIDDECQVSTDTIDATYQTEVEKTLLVLNYELTLDEEAPYTSNIKNETSFFNNFLKIKYTYNDKEYTCVPTNRTPNGMNNKVILEVDGKIKNASSITLVITIRNREYNITLK